MDAVEEDNDEISQGELGTQVGGPNVTPRNLERTALNSEARRVTPRDHQGKKCVASNNMVRIATSKFFLFLQIITERCSRTGCTIQEG
jgi:hypothetical protein